MRLDKFLSQNGCGTRSEVKNLIKKKQVFVNGVLCVSSDCNIAPDKDIITLKGTVVNNHLERTYILNKPAGYVCADKDDKFPTVFDLFDSAESNNLHCIGRLDKDTEGLLLLTTDGELNHFLTSPKNEIPKTYLVNCLKSVTDEDLVKLSEGVKIGEDEFTGKALVKRGTSDNEIYLTITEGKFHEVKRMLQTTANKVLDLKRVSYDFLSLDNENLSLGEYRLLTKEETNRLKRIE